MDVPIVTKVKVIPPYTIEVVFRDGHRRVVDMTGELWGEIFEPLKNPAFFAKAYVDKEAGTVCWPNGADLSPEWLYAPDQETYWGKAVLEDSGAPTRRRQKSGKK